MGILLYNNTPVTQLLRNSSFEEPISDVPVIGNWFFEGDVTRQTEIVAFGNFALRMTGTSFISQQSEELLVSGPITIGILVRGKTQLGLALSVFYELLDQDFKTIQTFSRPLLSSADNDFNLLYVKFNVPDSLVSGSTFAKVTYTVSGNGVIYLDNGKSQRGRKPTRFTVFPGEDPTIEEEIPTVFSTPSPSVADPLDQFGFEINFPELQPGGNASSDDNSPGSPKDKAERCAKEFKEFIDAYRKIIRKQADMASSRKEQRFFPTVEELRILNFKRDDLKKCLGEKEDISATQKAWIQYAATKIAALDRLWQIRGHTRIDKYSRQFMDQWQDYRFLQKELAAVKRFLRSNG